jgi:peptide/nickel transport system substrate-binding protein
VRPHSSPTGHVLHLSLLGALGQPPDPDIYYGGQGLGITTNVYEGLLTYKLGTATPVIIGELATSWTESANRLQYTFTLRQGVTFHDGTKFTSAAVEPSFARRAAVDAGPAYMVAGVKSVTTQGPYKVTINLKTPDSSFLDFLASPYGPKMLSPTGLKKYAGSDHDESYLATHDLGTGAYILSEAIPGEMYQLKAYPKWWGGKPYFTTVDLPVIPDLSTEELEFNNGQLAAIMHDLDAPAVASYSKSTSVDHYSLPIFKASSININPREGMFTSQAARDAFEQAINTKALTQEVFSGRGSPANSAYARDMLSVSGSQDITYDPSKLRALVKLLPASEKTLTFGYDTGQPDDQQAAELVAASLQSMGLTVTVQGYPTAEIGWANDLSQAPNVLFTETVPDAANPYTWAYIKWDTDGGINYEHCTDPTIEKLLPVALETGSTELYKRIGLAATTYGCWMNISFINDFMVAQPWLKNVAQAHEVGTPDNLRFSVLKA